MSEPSLLFSISPTQSVNKAWAAVISNLGVMAGFTILYYIATALLGRIPFIGWVINLLQFVFTASLFSAFDQIDRVGNITFSSLFEWTPGFSRLLTANLLMIAIALVFFIPFIIFLVINLGSGALSGFPNVHFRNNIFDILSLNILLGMGGLAFIGGVLLAIFTFAFMFIVQFTNMPVMDALKLSVKVGKRNVGQIIIWAFLTLGIAILGVLALCIGLLVAIPVIVGTQYYLLRSVFPIEEAGKWDFMEDTGFHA